MMSDITKAKRETARPAYLIRCSLLLSINKRNIPPRRGAIKRYVNNVLYSIL